MNDSQPDQINDESNYQRTLAILNEQSKPSKVLCKLMNMLESYRQSRKMGWSRPWNKYGLTTFMTFKLQADDEQQLIADTLSCLSEIESMTSEALDFCRTILDDRSTLMGFIFYSDYVEEKTNYQSVTLSFGRKVPGQPRYRDRFDIIFDLPVHEDTAKSPSRIRIYIDPFSDGNKQPLLQLALEPAQYPSFDKLFQALCQRSHEWSALPEKHWDHWTSRYIDYFGNRNSQISNAYF